MKGTDFGMKKITALIVSLLIVISMNCTVFAGMADWDDKSADEAANKQLQEQKNELTDIASKSSNNYLDKLSVEGYLLSPSFDKQTVNYDLGDVETNTLNIKTVLEDEKATVSGDGTVTLTKGENDIRIDVVSESGSTRTYHIKATYITSEDDEPSKDENTIQNNEVKETNTEIKTNVENTQTDNEKNSNTKAIIRIIIVALFAIIVIRAMKKK